MNWLKVILRGIEAGIAAVLSYLIVTSLNISNPTWIIILVTILVIGISAILPW